MHLYCLKKILFLNALVWHDTSVFVINRDHSVMKILQTPFNRAGATIHVEKYGGTSGFITNRAEYFKK